MSILHITLASSVLLVVLGATAGCILVDKLGGNYQHQPEEMNALLSPEAQALLDKAFADIKSHELMDYHAHVIGLPSGGNGAFVHPKSLTWKHPIRRIKTAVYMSGAGVDDLDKADEQYIERFVRLIRNQPKIGKHRIFAHDRYYNKDGTPNDERSEYYTPNEYVFELVERYPDAFLPVISVHPYRKDAIEELKKWADKGARYIRWLPNAMGMDASDPLIDEYYRVMKDYGMALLTHVGKEQAIEVQEDHWLGNPLLFRKPLDMNIKVIMAHCGSLGEHVDFDDPEGKRVPSFELVLRMMREPKYKELLFGNLAAMTQFNRLPKPLTVLLENPDLWPQLINGSGYPLPATNSFIHTRSMVKQGFITAEERKLLNEIYDYNPLLFDFALKRTLKLPGTDVGFSADVFKANPLLPK